MGGTFKDSKLYQNYRAGVLKAARELPLSALRFGNSVRRPVRRSAVWAHRQWHRLQDGRDGLEAFFLCLFLVALAILTLNIIWLLVFKQPVLFKEIIPQPCQPGPKCAPYDWDDFRSLMFGLAGMVGAVFGLYQLANSATRTRLTKEEVAQSTSRTKSTGQQTEIARQTERNVRYVKAVELLKDPDDSVRMGGIYSLARLAKEDPGYFDTVLEVLAAYIRYRTNAKDEEGNWSCPPRKGAGEIPPEDVEDYQEKLATWRQEAGPTEPIKAALMSLNRLWQFNPPTRDPTITVDLRGAWLPCVDLRRFEMAKWRFDDAFLQHAIIHRANLEKANLRNADLRASDLSRTRLRRSGLTGADLRRASLNNAHLQNALLIDAQLQNAWITDAQLEGTVLSLANLEGADLSDTNLQDAYLTRANLNGAALQGAILTDANNVTGQQLNSAVWPTGAPPSVFPHGFSTDMFDKSWCTIPDDIARLLPPEERSHPPAWKGN